MKMNDKESEIKQTKSNEKKKDTTGFRKLILQKPPEKKLGNTQFRRECKIRFRINVRDRDFVSMILKQKSFETIIKISNIN